MQEEYGIKLKILTDALKGNISQVKGMIHSFTNDVKRDTNIKVEIDPKLNINQLTKFKGEIESVINKLKEQQNFPGSWAPDEKLNSKIRYYENALEQVKERMRELGTESESTKQKMSGISISASMTNNNIVNGFQKSWRSIKKFAFALLSVRGIYGLIRKASSAYMAQDTQLGQQMQRTWASLGALMAPIIEKIVHWIRVAAAYINYFVKALTGKDLIGKAVKKVNAYNKSLGGTAKAVKSVNKELTTMDEVTNLSFDDGNINNFNDAISNTPGFDDFSDIELDPKITAILDKWAESAKKLWDNLKPVRDIIGKIVDWGLQHPGAVLTILGGAKLLSLVAGLTGANGLTALLPLLKGLAIAGVVVAGVDLIYNAVTGRNLIDDLKKIISGLNDLNNSISDNTKRSKDNSKQNKKLNDLYLEGLKTGKKTTKQYQQEADSLFRLTQRRRADREGLYEQYTLTGFFTGANKKLNQQRKEDDKQTYKNLQTLKEYNKAGVLTINQKEQYKQALIDEIEWLKTEYSTTDMNKKQAKEYNDKVKELQNQFKELTGRNYNTKIDVSTRDAKKNVDALKSPLDKLVSKVFKPKVDLKIGTKDAKSKIKDFAKKTQDAFVFGGIMNKAKTSVLNALLNAIPGYAVGTNYVPNDQLAMIHKGEAIVPKKFNDREFFNQSSEETNALLVELNQNIIELRNRPNVLEVNGRELAQATYSDYQNEGNRLNQSMTIKRSGN